MPATIGELRTPAVEDEAAGPQPRSSFDLKQYDRRRKKVAELAQRLAQIAEELGAPESAGSLRQAVGGMFEEVFTIVVVGEFSRGKSTVINALLGAQVLPKSPSETTAVLSQIDYSNVENYCLHFRDGRPTADVSAEYFAALVAPPAPFYDDDRSTRAHEERLAFLHTIEYVQIGYPCELCRDGVRIIDTPGTNGLNPAREEITYKFIPSADAVIFVLSAQTPATASELAFLRDQVMAADLGKIFLVMNFADSIETAKDRERVVLHAKREINGIIPSPEILLISAREALFHRAKKKTKLSMKETGYPSLESELAQFLDSERGWVRLIKPLDRGLRVAAELVGRTLMLLRRKHELPIAELKKKADEIRPLLKAIISERDSTQASLTLELTNKGQDLAREWRQGLEAIASLAEKTRASYQGRIDKDELIHAVERAVARPQTDLNEKMQAAQRAATADAFQAARNRLKEAWGCFYLEFDQVFSNGNEAGSATGSSDADKADEPVSDFGSGGDWPATSTDGFILSIAKSIANWFARCRRSILKDEMRAAIQERFSKTIPQQIENWRAGWGDHVARVEKALMDECNRKLRDTQQQLDSSVAEHESAEGSARQELSRLDDLEKEIISLQMVFNAIRNERGSDK